MESSQLELGFNQRKSNRELNGVIHHGDCLDVMRDMTSESIQLVVTSPPYNLRNSTGGGIPFESSIKWRNAAIRNGYKEHEDNLPHKEYVEWQRACLTEMFRLLRPDGAIFYNHKWRVQNGLLQDRSDIVNDFPVRQIIVWQRNGGMNFNDGYFVPTYEVIYLICKRAFTLLPTKNGIGDVWKMSHARNNPHPAPFPLELPFRCIESCKDGIVLDPFMGSGTTAIAAEKLGRQWVGIEQSQEYIKLAYDRLNAFSKVLTYP